MSLLVQDPQTPSVMQLKARRLTLQRRRREAARRLQEVQADLAALEEEIEQKFKTAQQQQAPGQVGEGGRGSGASY